MTNAIDSAFTPLRIALSLALAGSLLLGCASNPQVEIPTSVPELRPGIISGYLPRNALPDSLALPPGHPVARQVAVSIAARSKDFSSRFPTITVSKDT